MKLKKNKFKFNAPSKYKTGEIFAKDQLNKDSVIDIVVSMANDVKSDITVEKAERMLKTVELSRAEIDIAIASARANQPLSEKDKQLLHTASFSRAEVDRALALKQQGANGQITPSIAENSISSERPASTNSDVDALVFLLDNDECVVPKVMNDEASIVSAKPDIAKQLTSNEKSEKQDGYVADTSAENSKNINIIYKKEPQKNASKIEEANASLSEIITPEITVQANEGELSDLSQEKIFTGKVATEQLNGKHINDDFNNPKSFMKRLLAPANISFLMLVLIFMAPIYLINYAFGELYYIYENGENVAIVFSKSDKYKDIVEKAGLELHDADLVVEDTLGTTSYLTVTRSYDVSVVSDGQTISHQVLGNTTAQALEQLGIVLGDDDIVEPALDKVLSENETITVKRVRYEVREATEVVPWEETTKPSPLIKEGKKQVMNEGGERDGLAYRTYRDQYIDGELAKSEIVEETYEDFPWNVVTLEGKDDAIMSHIDGSKYTEVKIVDNAPEKFERVLSNAVCTAYSFKPGTWGASGMYMVQGFVAVNTNVIPYGSLLYITSPTGKFTYGWAIAADVGEAMMAGYVDIDCFFETYTESALFGKNKMNVYVVDQLTQSQLENYIGNAGMFRSRLPQ